MKIYKILWTSVSSENAAKNTDQQSLLIKELLIANARQEKEIQIENNAIATTARERANLNA